MTKKRQNLEKSHRGWMFGLIKGVIPLSHLFSTISILIYLMHYHFSDLVYQRTSLSLSREVSSCHHVANTKSLETCKGQRLLGAAVHCYNSLLCYCARLCSAMRSTSSKMCSAQTPLYSQSFLTVVPRTLHIASILSDDAYTHLA